MISLKEKWTQGITWKEYFILSAIMTIIGIIYGVIYWVLDTKYSVWIEAIKRRIAKTNPGRYGW